MSMGFQAFIKGTSFDTLNAMSFNFVADIKTVSGTGSTTYSLPGFTLSAALMNTVSLVGVRQYSVSVSGQTVSWSVANACKIMVTATPSNVSSSLYFGFSLYDYSTNPRTFKIAPDFTPYNLAQVIDITPAYGQVLQTSIPSTMQMIAFHRGTGSTYDHVWWSESVVNGFWALTFRPNTGLNAMTACRIYIFAKRLVNPPDFGFFLYRSGALVWHNNCLPLNMKILNGGTVTSSTPLAITNGVTGCLYQRADPAFPTPGTQWYNCASAGMSGASYACTTLDRYQQTVVSNGNEPGTWAAGTLGYIDCNVYDSYYKQALGL